MKNNKIIIWVVLLMSGYASGNVMAQGFYGGVSVGYGLPMNGRSLDYLGMNSSSSNSSTTDEEEKVSLGTGLTAGVKVGYQFTPYVSAELGISYLLGSESKSEVKNNGDVYYSRTISSNMIRFIPAVVFSAGLDKINPYARLGLVVGSSSIKFTENNNGDGYYFTEKN